MADNIDVTPGSGKTIAADEISSVLHQRVKVQYGEDGSATDVSDTNPLPIDDAGGSLTVDGSVSLAAAIPAGTNNIGDVDVASVAIPTSIYHGVKTVTTATTAEALASSQAILSGVRIKALSDNTGVVYVGDSDVAAANGFPLAADEELFLEVANLASVYLDVSVSGEGVSYIAT